MGSTGCAHGRAPTYPSDPSLRAAGFEFAQPERFDGAEGTTAVECAGEHLGRIPGQDRTGKAVAVDAGNGHVGERLPGAVIRDGNDVRPQP
jgi:hypothetical protein